MRKCTSKNGVTGSFSCVRVVAVFVLFDSVGLFHPLVPQGHSGFPGLTYRPFQTTNLAFEIGGLLVDTGSGLEKVEGGLYRLVFDQFEATQVDFPKP